MSNLLYYFAYGSNMLNEQLQDKKRCPSVRPVGVAFVDGYALDFSKHSSIDKSGKATIFQSPGSRQYGVVFTIKEDELPELDSAEGLGAGYYKEEPFNVIMVDTRVSKTAFTYIANDSARDKHLKPYDWYLAYVVAGAKQNNLPEDVIKGYRRTDYEKDRDAKRRCDELKILEKAKLGSIEDLLQSK